MALILLVFLFPHPLWSQDTDAPVVFLDPGHGGQDTGARGANGLLEKEVALALATAVTEKLAPRYSVRLTRNGDYSLDLFHRTQTANSRNADLFISLHTGGGFSYSAEGITLFFFQDPPGRQLPESQSEDPAAGQTAWDQVQYRHTAKSRLLADVLKAALSNQAGDAGCRIVGTPLLSLASADMPAVLIEVGGLNSPAEEEKLSSSGYIVSLAGAICRGLEEYLGGSSGIISIDLHE